MRVRDKGHVTTRYYGWYANRPRGMRRQAEPAPADAPRRVIRQNLFVSLGVIAVLIVATTTGVIGIGAAVVMHEGSTLLALNGVMFVIEVSAGLAADSMGLAADGLDMLADAAVYGLSLYAVGRPARAKVRAALRGLRAARPRRGRHRQARFALVHGSAPEVLPMLGISLLALGVNVWSLAILKR